MADIPDIPRAREAGPLRRPRRRTATRHELRTNALDAMGDRPRLVVRAPEEAVAIREEWRRFGRHRDEAIGPAGLDAPSRLVGDPIPLQITRFVEETAGFESWRTGSIDHEAFFSRLAERLPYEFFGPWRGLCEAELEEMGREPAEPTRADDDWTLPGMRRAD